MPTWALDLDGVVWTGGQPIAGSAAAVTRLDDAGCSVVFVTNNSFATIQEQEQKLASFGIDGDGRVATSAQAAATLVDSDDRVLVFGGPGVREAVAASGSTLVAGFVDGDEPPSAVVVGLDWELSYDRLRAAIQAIASGARFIATNTDPTYPTERGQFPGAGALVAAVRTSTGVDPTIAGKPHRPMAELIRAQYGSEGIVVGDRADTDGRFSIALGYRFGLVLSGVTAEADLPTDPAADVVAPDLASLVDEFVR